MLFVKYNGITAVGARCLSVCRGGAQCATNELGITRRSAVESIIEYLARSCIVLEALGHRGCSGKPAAATCHLLQCCSPSPTPRPATATQSTKGNRRQCQGLLRGDGDNDE